jgi:hypothetical protein
VCKFNLVEKRKQIKTHKVDQVVTMVVAVVMVVMMVDHPF